MYSPFGLLLAVLGAGLPALSGSARAEPSRSQVPAAAAPAAVTVVDGTLKISIVAVNKSAIPVNSTLWCSARVFLSQATAHDYDFRHYFVKATVTPTQVSCTVKVPYREAVTDPATAVMDVLPSISSTPLPAGAILPFVIAPPKTELSATMRRLSFPLPAAGAITFKSVYTFL